MRHRLPGGRRLVAWVARPAAGALGAVALTLGLAAPALAATSCPTTTTSSTPTTAPPLRFGIYPGGTAGSVAGKADALPEVPSARLAALQQLKGSASHFGVHLYTAYTGNARADEGTAIWMDGEVAAYTAAGIDVELAVRYKPVLSDTAAAVSGFAAYVRDQVRRYGSNARFTSLQVTNEANLGGAPDASDGAFAGATDALVAGVIAAKDEARRRGASQVRVGFNWASDARPGASTDFWAALARGGSTFAQAVDWVGLDAYPGTWYPSLDVSTLLPGQAGSALDTALATLRGCHMPAAGLGRDVPIHVTENGYPTGPGRPDATQALVLEAMVRQVSLRRAAYNVTDYSWFDLRDSRSSDPSMESRYGIMRDDYTPKPAFDVYRRLVAELSGDGAALTPGAGAPAPAGDAPSTGTAAPGATGTAGTNTTCARSPLTVALPPARGFRPWLYRVWRAGRVVLTRRSAASRVRVALAPGRARLTIRVSGHRGGRAATRVVVRTATVCAPARR